MHCSVEQFIFPLQLPLDEKDEVCRKCPPHARSAIHEGSYPPWENRGSARLSCKHRYTDNWICAVPCDNIDDLCSGFEDEMNCGVSLLVQILPIAVILIISLTLTFYDILSLRGHKFLKGVKGATLSLLPSSQNFKEECMLITQCHYEQEVRGHKEFKESLQNLVSIN